MSSQEQSVSPFAILNQPPSLDNYNTYSEDSALREQLNAYGANWAQDKLGAFGKATGSSEVKNAGFAANRYGPELRTHDRYGRRIDEVDFHPTYHLLMKLAFSSGMHAIAWSGGKNNGHLVHAAMVYLMTQAEPGVCCPAAMTYAAVPVLHKDPELSKAWVPKLLSEDYDARSIPPSQKTALTIGMAMTEKQGGSDIRANITEARSVDENLYQLHGHKWFCSAPMSDAFLTLAQTADGLSCFLVPRWRSDGSRNAINIQRLKNKLGNRANASAEIEYHGANARLIGLPGAGIKTIIDMVHHTRLDASAAPAGLMRQAVVQAIHHCQHRQTFGKALLKQPLMQNLLADLALESEAALRLVLRAAKAFDDGETDPRMHTLARVITPVAKYWLNKRTPNLVYECMEVLGGNGYVEDSILPRLYREAPVNSIWEGSGNIMCLDVLRTLKKKPMTAQVLLDEFEPVRGQHATYDQTLDQVKITMEAEIDSLDARRFVEQLALLLQAKLMMDFAGAEKSALFIESRLSESRSHCFGTLKASSKTCLKIIATAWKSAASV